MTDSATDLRAGLAKLATSVERSRTALGYSADSLMNLAAFVMINRAAIEAALGNDEAVLRSVVDRTWQHALEDQSVPSHEVATAIIDKARSVVEGGGVFGSPLPDYIIDSLKPGDRVLVEAVVGARRFNGGWPVHIVLDNGESCTICDSGIVHVSALRAVVKRGAR